MHISPRTLLAIVIIMVVIWTGTVSWVAIKKFNHFGFDALDLGIYGQVFHNTGEGRLFEFSIHPHSYLGDHVELFILPLIPLYLVWPTTAMLLVLQALALASGAIPLYLIARHRIKGQYALLLTSAYLLYPILFNIALFEFHVLPFAIPLLFWMLYLYLQKKFAPFIILALLTLSVREDVALVVGMLGILALIEKRSWRWILTPITVSGAWFLAATNIAGYFNQTGGYKFISLYSWLGETPKEIIVTVLTKPWLPLGQIVSVNNFLLILGLTLPLAALPLVKWKYYLVPALVALQLFLAPFSATILIQTHYTSLLIPFIFLAVIMALTTPLPQFFQKPMRWLNQVQPLPVVLASAAVLYSFVTLSPLMSLVTKPSPNVETKASIEIKHAAIDHVHAEDAVVASFDVLPALADRDRLYSLHYAFLGHRQYSDVPFVIPQPITSLVIDASDFIVYQLQAQTIYSYEQYYDEGAARIRSLITENNLHIASVVDSTIRYAPIDADQQIPYAIDSTLPSDSVFAERSLNDQLLLLGWRQGQPCPTTIQSGRIIPIELYWRPTQAILDDYVLDVQIHNANGALVYHKYYPFGYGIYPTSDWTPGNTVQTNYWFAIPEEFAQTANAIQLQVMTLEGYMTLDAGRSTAMHISHETLIGEPIPLTLK